MITKTLHKTCILLVILSFSNLVEAQNTEQQILQTNLLTLQFLEANNNDSKFYDGEIYLKNQDTLRGSISLNHAKAKTYAAILSTDDGYEYISNQEIESVVLYGEYRDQALSSRFVPLKDHELLYREVYKKDEHTAIYDGSTNPFRGILVGRVLVKDHNTIEDIFNFWASGPKKDLINYINKRDNKNYKRRDFKTIEDLFAKL
ncbi:hypothetical protein [uncultured Psychroserpens sp.]|uniref:hypothetical protein n=1 Tax=uncultured Psychroserpens sp. TaxID=255436 RepID=UPI00260ABE19|nr:hypothetical protein [uncultured Psychroserpens sp.]